MDALDYNSSGGRAKCATRGSHGPLYPCLANGWLPHTVAAGRTRYVSNGVVSPVTSRIITVSRMSGIEGPAASAALGQVKGLVDAILGPKLERIKKWSHRKDVQARVSSAKMDALFARYLSRAITHFCQVQSVVFPGQNLPLLEIYEPLRLTQNTQRNKTKIVSGRDLLDQRAHSMIVDGAGMGKTTFLKFVMLDIVQSGDRVPILVNLREYSGDLALVDWLCRQLDELDEKFDPELFQKFLVDGHFCIGLDGFDEVEAQKQSSVRSSVEVFVRLCGKSQIILTSRNQNNLPLIALRVMEFERLDHRQIKAIFQRYDKFSGLSQAERLISQIDEIPHKLLRTPLLVSLLYRCYGYTRHVTNELASFYSDTFDALYKGHDLTTKGYIRQKHSGLDFTPFRSVIRAFSFLSIATSTTSWKSLEQLIDALDKSVALSSVSPTSTLALSDDLLSAVPYLIKDGQEYRFIHKTFAEHFAAEHIVFAPNSDALLRNIHASENRRIFMDVFDFVHEISPSLARLVFVAPCAKFVIDAFSAKSVDLETTLLELFRVDYFQRSTSNKLSDVLSIFQGIFDRNDNPPQFGRLQLTSVREGFDWAFVRLVPLGVLADAPRFVWRILLKPISACAGNAKVRKKVPKRRIAAIRKKASLAVITLKGDEVSDFLLDQKFVELVNAALSSVVPDMIDKTDIPLQNEIGRTNSDGKLRTAPFKMPLRAKEPNVTLDINGCKAILEELERERLAKVNLSKLFARKN